MTITTESLASALEGKRFETARRLGLELIAAPGTLTAENLVLLHDALIALADFHAARELLESHQEVFRDDPFQAALKLA